MITELTSKISRKFLPADLLFEKWEHVEPYYTELEKREIHSVNELEKWMLDFSELEAFVSETFGWKYIRMTCDTTNQEALNAYTYFVTEVEPKISPKANALQKKLMASPFVAELDQKKYFIYLRAVKKSLELFREENIPLLTELNNEAQKYGAITGAQTITHNDKELTLQQAALLFREQDRKLREEIFFKISQRKDVDEAKLDELFDKLIALRHQVALNAGFKNYRDYKFEELGRFDYKPVDCENFHASIKKHLVPLQNEIEKKKKLALNLSEYRPWDTEVDPEGKTPLKPFATGKELLEKSIACFYKVDSYCGDCLTAMKQMHHLDLESRKGKAPGGYNYPLYETGVPFIFMNAVGAQRDVVTMVHEGGHAVHSFITRKLPLVEFKNVPSEVAELASMGMELISMAHWDVFYDKPDDLKRAKKEQLEKIIKTLCWIASIDKFQHWLYLNPNHTHKERNDYWVSIHKDFGSSVIDYSGLERNLRRQWQGQLHLFEVPFYYIEYGFAQLGAIALWRNYTNNPQKTLKEYLHALSLGYTVSIPELYEAAGIRFDFSEQYIGELIQFVNSQYKVLL